MTVKKDQLLEWPDLIIIKKSLLNVVIPIN